MALVKPGIQQLTCPIQTGNEGTFLFNGLRVAAWTETETTMSEADTRMQRLHGYQRRQLDLSDRYEKFAYRSQEVM